MGLGYHRDFPRVYAEAGLHASIVMDRQTKLTNAEDHCEDNAGFRSNAWYRANVRLGMPVYGKLGIFGGLTYNLVDFGEKERLMGSWTEDLTGTSDERAWWPGLEVGIRLGR
jgi:hypothetical protein